MDINKKNTTQTDKKRAQNLFQEGAKAWQQGERGKAMTLYAQSAELDPEGPGTHALKMAQDIMAFYDTNRLNP